jgi:prolyl-tRNA editing enzyme YbaK/EbsC (Cys-tRNA(Pro) deacylase)
MTCASVSEVTAITGYEIGTIAPLLLSSPIPIFFDSSLQSKNTITISSGNKLAGISLNILDLMRLCAPRIADISKD